MDIVLPVLSALFGIGVGYLIYYWKYENRDMIRELRKTNTELRTSLQGTDRDRMEYEQQNIILKNEIKLLYQKNDDLTQLVSELSRYYYHMKKVSIKMHDLSHDLKQPLEELDQQLKPFLYAADDEHNEKIVYQLDEDEGEDSNAGFF